MKLAMVHSWSHYLDIESTIAHCVLVTPFGIMEFNHDWFKLWLLSVRFYGCEKTLISVGFVKILPFSFEAQSI